MEHHEASLPLSYIYFVRPKEYLVALICFIVVFMLINATLCTCLLIENISTWQPIYIVIALKWPVYVSVSNRQAGKKRTQSHPSYKTLTCLSQVVINRNTCEQEIGLGLISFSSSFFNLTHRMPSSPPLWLLHSQESTARERNNRPDRRLTWKPRKKGKKKEKK